VSLSVTTEVFVETDVPAGITESRLVELVEFGLAAEGATGQWQIELVLGDDGLLQQLHRDFMGLDSPTDIMTFPEIEETGDRQVVTGGQVYISVDRAAAQAPDFGLSVADELQFLVLHGVLHLCGWDDATDTMRSAMLDRQAELLRAFAHAGGDEQSRP
jgi:probable rRNA maturation factor